MGETLLAYGTLGSEKGTNIMQKETILLLEHGQSAEITFMHFVNEDSEAVLLNLWIELPSQVIRILDTDKSIDAGKVLPPITTKYLLQEMGRISATVHKLGIGDAIEPKPGKVSFMIYGTITTSINTDTAN